MSGAPEQKGANTYWTQWRSDVKEICERYITIANAAKGINEKISRAQKSLETAVDMMATREEAQRAEKEIQHVVPMDFQLTPKRIDAVEKPQFSPLNVFEQKIKDRIEKEALNLTASGKIFDVMDMNSEEKLLDMLLERRMKRQASGKRVAESPASTSFEKESAVDALSSMSTYADKFGGAINKGVKRRASASASASGRDSNGKNGSSAEYAKKAPKRDAAAFASSNNKPADTSREKKAVKSLVSLAPPGPVSGKTARRSLESAPYFRQRVAREIADLYLESKEAPQYMIAKFPFVNMIELPTTWNRFSKGMEGAGIVIANYVGHIVDQIMLREADTDADQFNKIFPNFEANVLLTKTKFPENDRDIYNESQAYKTMCIETAQLTPHWSKLIFQDVDEYPLRSIPFSSDRSKRLNLQPTQLYDLQKAKTFGALIQVLKQHEEK